MQDLAPHLDVLKQGNALAIPSIAVAELPLTPGSYCIWDSQGSLIYSGLAGVRWTPERPSPTSTLRQRLSDHLSAHRADVLTSYLFERVVCRTLTIEQARLMADGKLGMRTLVLEELSKMLLTWTSTRSYAEAKQIEDAVRSGVLGHRPLINPLQ